MKQKNHRDDDSRLALIYCRVSSERQVKEGHGLESQEHRCKQYAKEKGLEVAQVFYDEGISGGLFDRPAMEALLAYLDKHWQNKYFIIFDDLKRFARDVQVHIKLRSEFQGRGAKLLCLNYNFDDSPEGEFVETIFAAQNQLDRKQNRRQVCQKMKARLEKGYWTFCSPTGYEYQKTQEHGKLLIQIKEIADVVAEAINGFASNRFIGQVDMQRFLENNKAFKIFHKGTVHLSLVERFLTDPIYAGLIEYKPWDVSIREGHHKGIIEPETYYKIQEKLKKPERKPRATDRLEWPLRRIVSCEICGKQMTGSCNRSKDPNKYYAHYTCNNKECSATPKNITASLMEKQYFEMLEKIKPEKEIIELTKAIAKDAWLEKTTEYKKWSEGRDRELLTLEEEIEQLIELVSKTKLASVRERYEARIESLDKRIKESRIKIDFKKEPDFEVALQTVLDFVGTPATYWKNADREKRILIHNLIFTENPRYSFQNGFGTPNLSVPFYIKHYVMGQKNGLVEVRGVAPLSKRLKTDRLQV